MGLSDVNRMGFNEILKKLSYITEREHFKDTNLVGSIILK